MIDFILRTGAGFFAYPSFGYMSLGVDGKASPSGEPLKRHLDFNGFAWGIGFGYQFHKVHRCRSQINKDTVQGYYVHVISRRYATVVCLQVLTQPISRKTAGSLTTAGLLCKLT